LPDRRSGSRRRSAQRQLPRQIRFSSRLACQVGSHKDSAGSAAANQKLYGQNRPVADYDTEKKRVQNRGIEFTTVN
jgi:hypothetical protein